MKWLRNWSALRTQNRSRSRSGVVPRLESLEGRDLPSATLPAAPVFTATAVSGSQVNLAWNRIANANGYVVDEWTGSAWKQIGAYNSATTGVTVIGLAAGATYYFDVGAYNTAGTDWAAYKSATTTNYLNISINHPGDNGQAYRNVNGPLFAGNGPSYLDVEQGNEGDCWLMASLAEVAARSPNIIRNMFTYDGQTMENGASVGVYTVHLFGNNGAAVNVVVDTELPDGETYFDHVPADGALWAALAEKAVAEAISNSKGSDNYAALNGGDPAQALGWITGKSASDFAINPGNLAAAWNAGKFIVMGTGNPSSPYIVGDHAYAVVGYNAGSSMPFEVYNPWGTNSSGWALGTYQNHAVYGLFWANGAFLSQNFAYQSVAGAANTSDAVFTGGQPTTNGYAPAVVHAPLTGFAVTSSLADAMMSGGGGQNLTPADAAFMGLDA